MQTPKAFIPAGAGLLGLALVILMPGFAAAAWPTDPLVNVPLCTAANNQIHQTIVADGIGGAFVVWDDYRSGANYDIYAQHVLASGTVDPAWPTDGRALCTAANNQTNPSVTTDRSGGAIVIWLDSRSGTSTGVFAQHVLASGTVDPGWPANGRILCSSATGTPPTTVADGAGGAIAAWNDPRGGCYAQHVLASGGADPAWPANGRALGIEYGPIAADGAGGVIATGGSLDIRAQHVLASGVLDPAWPASGVALCTAVNNQTRPVIAADGAGGAVVTWLDRRNGTNWDIYAQHVLASGVVDPAWPTDGRALCTATGDQQLATIVADGAGGAIAAWEDWRGIAAIYAQHVLASGMVDPVWPANGRPLCTAANVQYYPTIVEDNARGAIVTWEDFRSGANYDIYAQHVLAGGVADPAWPATGRALCIAAKNQFYPMIVEDGVGGAIVTWGDDRNSPPYGNNQDIYAQRVMANGQLGGDLPTPTLVSLVAAEAHEGMVRLRWYVSRDEAVTLTVYRSTGADAWQALGTVIPDGSSYVSYEDARVAAGARYGYRLGIRPGAEAETFAGEAWVDVPGADLAVRVPNPVVSGEVTVSFAPPAGRSVRVSLVDLAGRMLASRLVAGGSGRQSVRLARSNDLAPGVYLVRVELDRPVVARVAVIR